jgi:two-component system OmpR family sensor kinase
MRKVDSFEPVSDSGVPREVSPLLAELNFLLSRFTQTLHSQRQFVADAAHELRSPLTALKLQVQTLARAKDETAREQAIARLEGGVDRASRLVEQLLALARQDPSSPLALNIVSLPACIRQAIADVAPFALSKDIQLQCGVLAQCDISGDEDSLRIMIRNLVDNAVRYTPEHGIVEIALAADPGHVALTIQDSGAGIPQQERARVFDRFYRVSGTEANGSGLGLAIVKAIAERHKATVELGDSALGGLTVKILFPE